MELRCAFINVMQATEDRLGDDLARWSGCENGVGQRSRAGWLLMETAMRTMIIVVSHELIEDTLQMPFVEDEHMI